jgi:hypothetical protein
MPFKIMPSAVYRAYQFFVALRAYLPGWAGGIPQQLSPADENLIGSILLTPAQRDLFNRMPPNDRRHALAVTRTLQQAGHTAQPLLQAALLHDVGKSLGQPLTHRVLIVLLDAFWPALLGRLSQPTQTNRWLRPFVIHARHPLIGAEWAATADCTEIAVSLIARHEEKINLTDDKLLATLQWADNLN